MSLPSTARREQGHAHGTPGDQKTEYGYREIAAPSANRGWLHDYGAISSRLRSRVSVIFVAQIAPTTATTANITNTEPMPFL